MAWRRPLPSLPMSSSAGSSTSLRTRLTCGPLRSPNVSAARLAGRHACCYQLDRAVPLGTGDAAALSALVSAPRPPLGVLAATRVTAIRIATLLYESSTSSGNLPATHPLNGHRVAQMIPRLLASACMSASNTFDANLVGAVRNALIAVLPERERPRRLAARSVPHTRRLGPQRRTTPVGR